ncbi:hypothetical protein Tco_0849890 [Tanacetum coccineum]
MATVEVPQTLEYRGGQLNAAPVLEEENFTNWKKRFMCHIIGIEPQFENIISNGTYISMAAGQRTPERNDANLDQRLKSLIMSVLPDDEMNSDDEEVSSDENEITKVKAFMSLTDEERISVGKESARNGDWTKISMKKVHTLLQMEDNDDRKSFLDYLCIDLNYVEE